MLKLCHYHFFKNYRTNHCIRHFVRLNDTFCHNTVTHTLNSGPQRGTSNTDRQLWVHVPLFIHTHTHTHQRTDTYTPTQTHTHTHVTSVH
jgi:hypothetical protein